MRALPGILEFQGSSMKVSSQSLQVLPWTLWGLQPDNMEAVLLFQFFGNALSKKWGERIQKEGDICGVVGDVVLVTQSCLGFTGRLGTSQTGRIWLGISCP